MKQRYSVTGKIVSLDPSHQRATIDAAAIPNYMEAMTMEYPIQTEPEFKALRVGEQITGILNIAQDDSYTLSDIKQK